MTDKSVFGMTSSEEDYQKPLSFSGKQPDEPKLPIAGIQLINGAKFRGSPGGLNWVSARKTAREAYELSWHELGVRVQHEMLTGSDKWELIDDLVIPWANIREIRLVV